MPLRCCRVTFEDFDNVAHTVEVTATTLYEAVAQALVALRGHDWVAGLRQGTVTVSVTDVRVEHKVELTEFTKWLDRANGSPREVIQRQKLRSILGMPAPR
jgi:phosphoserine aminotransferase